MVQAVLATIKLPSTARGFHVDVDVLRIMKMLVIRRVKWSVEMFTDALPICLSEYKSPRDAVTKSIGRIVVNLNMDGSELVLNMYDLGVNPLPSGKKYKMTLLLYCYLSIAQFAFRRVNSHILLQ